jgi:hypothetical protein
MVAANAEPSLDEMLDDPIIRLRMKGACVGPDKIRTCLLDAKRRLQDRDKADAARSRSVSDRLAAR